MLTSVPNEQINQQSSYPMMSGFLIYLQNLININCSVILSVDDESVHIPGQQDLLSLKHVFSILIGDPAFRSSHQQDAGEALSRILDALQSEEVNQHANFPLTISNYEIQYRYTCSRCPQVEYSYPAVDNILRIPVPEKEVNSQFPNFDMEDALMNVLTNEHLVEEKVCTGCDMPGVLQRLIMTTSNEFLVIQLLFFDNQQNKISASCTPLERLEVNVSGLVIQYELQFIIEHHGNRAKSGHYICCFKMQNMWHRANDLQINTIDPDNLPKQPYICIYKKM